MTSINACASARFAVRMKPPTPMREIVHSSIGRARRSAAIGLRPMPFRKLPQTNDRFKRGAGYLGTAVSSMMRSGRRPWPGQYALPYILWTGPYIASLGAGASKPFSITM